ncbi:hypothetical protein BJ138DRAFT_1119523 [Hygrophoropsis aurantiaca]|uniref:Uncharacterized protein n=1 Tax=Hygrophoropsis aurantiaca TaxID=72124 RepID=A0ACB7ZT48_9AGAM|nr:hypothetical protein BJ138DRAFT_1119523 [Hygrophoropsis aurantiaca]
MVAGGSDFITTPRLHFSSEMAEQFLRVYLCRDPLDIATKFESTLVAQSVNQGAPSTYKGRISASKTAIRTGLQLVLIKITQDPNATMEYVRYEVAIICRYHIKLIGWAHTEWANPSDLKGGADALEKLAAAITDNWRIAAGETMMPDKDKAPTSASTKSPSAASTSISNTAAPAPAPSALASTHTPTSTPGAPASTPTATPVPGAPTASPVLSVAAPATGPPSPAPGTTMPGVPTPTPTTVSPPPPSSALTPSSAAQMPVTGDSLNIDPSLLSPLGTHQPPAPAASTPPASTANNGSGTRKRKPTKEPSAPKPKRAKAPSMKAKKAPTRKSARSQAAPKSAPTVHSEEETESSSVRS